MMEPRLPVERTDQRLLERRVEGVWSTSALPADVRPVVRDSWARALTAGIRPELPHAPLVLSTADLHAARERTDWLALAEDAVSAQRGAYASGGHILALFDRAGRMLHHEGDPAALERLDAINFRPGALWAEHAVGTNGPGTALATGQPTHIVGAEHYCRGWREWHCAAVPIRDRTTGDIQGAVDISGFRESAHPHTLVLAVAIAVAVEQMLVSRAMERRVRVLNRFADLTSRWPGDALVAVDRTGALLSASARAPAALHPFAPVPERLRTALVELVESFTGDAPREVWLPSLEGSRAVAHPVFDGSIAIGACLLIPERGRASARALVSGVPAPRARTGPPGAATRHALADLIGESAALRDAQRVAVAAAANTLPVLLLGESGTGKEMFAQGIHGASARAARPFIAVNCAALPSELVESELFGYVGGAFSGARKEGSAGKFEAADGGTIFLDEVGELPPAAQAALLRVLEENEVTRVGATRGVPVDVRVIAATNRDIRRALERGGFREDLYYRLGVLGVELPALRERTADIPGLARHFLAGAEAELGRSGYAFAPQALDAMRAYAWPGNIRELRNLVWRTVALATEPVIGLEDLPAEVRDAYAGGGAAGGGGARAAASLRDAGPGDAPPGADDRRDDRWHAERERLVRAVEHAATMADAARILGVARSTFYRQLERYAVRPRRTARE
jgi:sigma-54 dependent transcriptional regulator, acetoin dehydrogenase operon transcriptional activator AcoR